MPEGRRKGCLEVKKSRAARGSIGAWAVLSAVSAVAFAASCSEGSDPPTNETANAAGPTTGTVGTNGNATVDGAAGPSTTVGDPAVTSTSASGVTTTGGATVTSAVTSAGVGGTGSSVTTDAAATTNPATTVSTTEGTSTTGGDQWWFSGPRTPPAIGSWPPPAIKLTQVSAATQPTAIAAPRHDATRLYFTEKWGAIRLIKDGVLLEEPALDISDAVLEGGPSADGTELRHQGKRGLVGLAFDPNYETNGRIFVMYTADQGIKGYGTNDHSNVYDDGDMTIEEYRRSADNPDKFDPASKKLIVQWDKGNCDQCSQHNGGSLEIDVNGFLWASSGDPPPYDNPGSQDLNSLNGKLLRFDISGDTVVGAGNYPGASDPAIASIGIRNAYKFSVDRYTGDVYVGDVGENVWEEVSVEPYGKFNRNHGWPLMEGLATRMDYCLDENCLDPVIDYQHSGSEGTPGADNCIIGGYVYRGQAIPQLQGTYLYGDFGSGKIRGIQVQDGVLLHPTGQEKPHDFGLPATFMGCFGEDAAGEMYVCDYEGGKILRIDAQ